ncbi:MAG: hypothetical protein QM504_05530 [Pseudomonadota bacterium]
MKNSFLLLLILFTLPLPAKTFKCWTNSDGIRECGNSLPPEYVKQRVEFLNEKSGRVSDITEAAKTKQQIFAEKVHLKQQQQQEKERAKQNAYDNVLLKTYLSIDDLLLSLHWKITTLNSRINVTQGTIRAENEKFLQAARQAAQMERTGKKLSDEIKTELKNSRNHVKKLTQRIIMLEKDKKDIHTKFSHDVDRFTIATINGLTLTLKDDEKAQKLNMIQIKCIEKNRCDQMWSVAKAFINQQSNLDIVFDTTQVHTTTSPKRDNDMAYTVSRASSTYNNKKSEKITLKIRCQPSRTGEELCKSSKMIGQLHHFKKKIMSVPVQ